MKKRRSVRVPFLPVMARAVKFSFKNQLFTVWLALCALGYVVGLQARPEAGSLPYEELFENMSVRSYRDAPSDTIARFVVELSARGRVFRQYDVDARQFVAPDRARDYGAAISGTRYPALRVRGHVDRGFWLEMPDSSRQALLPDQFEELYRTTLDYVRPVSIVTNVLSTLSGYTVGYRIAAWNASLSNPRVQERVVSTPGIGRTIAREAWKRVLLEPVVAPQESDAARFASASGTQRIYTNFFRLAVSDSNGFIPREAARLDSAGCGTEARAMLAFARAARCAASDTCDLTSADFAAVETWALLLDRRGHWATRAIPADATARLQYLGTLAWYGIEPGAGDERRLWVGPRLLVRSGDTEGFVADDVPSIAAGCPIAWRPWLRGDAAHPSGNAWTAQWMAESRQIAPLVSFATGIARAFSAEPSRAPLPEQPREPREPPRARDDLAGARIPDTMWVDSTLAPGPAAALPTSASTRVAAADSAPAGPAARALPAEPSPHVRAIRANMNGMGP